LAAGGGGRSGWGGGRARDQPLGGGGAHTGVPDGLRGGSARARPDTSAAAPRYRHCRGLTRALKHTRTATGRGTCGCVLFTRRRVGRSCDAAVVKWLGALFVLVALAGCGGSSSHTMRSAVVRSLPSWPGQITPNAAVRAFARSLSATPRVVRSCGVQAVSFFRAIARTRWVSARVRVHLLRLIASARRHPADHALCVSSISGTVQVQPFRGQSGRSGTPASGCAGRPAWQLSAGAGQLCPPP
jgi:hypothetical protein